MTSIIYIVIRMTCIILMARRYEREATMIRRSPMGTSQADKAASHRRIVAAAAAQIRRGGFDSISVAALMHDAGLTHGAFYRHFESREALIAEAVEEALKSREYEPGGDPDGRTYPTPAAYIDEYLAADHRDHPETGCPVAGLAADVSRADEGLRETYAKNVRRFLAFYGSRGSTPSAWDEDRPHVTVAAMVGAVVLARALGPGELSDEILARTASGLHQLHQRNSD